MLRFHQVLFVAAGALFFVGFAFLDTGLNSATALRGEETFLIPAGGQWYYVVELPMQEGGRVHIDFEETSERAINVYLMPQDDYELYEVAGGVLPGVGGMTGPSGLFAQNIRSAGTYYLVFEHTAENAARSQEVRLRYSFTGVQPAEADLVLAGAGVGSLAGGAVVVALAAVRRLRAVRVKETEPPAAEA